MEETAPLWFLAQEGFPPPVQGGVGLANCTGSVEESQAIDQWECLQKIVYTGRMARQKVFLTAQKYTATA